MPRSIAAAKPCGRVPAVCRQLSKRRPLHFKTAGAVRRQRPQAFPAPTFGGLSDLTPPFVHPASTTCAHVHTRANSAKGQPSPLRAPRHRGGMMAEATGKSAPQHPVRAIVDNKSRRSLYTATTVRRRSARWRTCEAHHRSVVSRLAVAGRERLRSPPVFRKAALAVFPLAFAV